MGRNKKTKLSTSGELTRLIGLSHSLIAKYPPISSLSIDYLRWIGRKLIPAPDVSGEMRLKTTGSILRANEFRVQQYASIVDT